jgi:hypothetical protein
MTYAAAAALLAALSGATLPLYTDGSPNAAGSPNAIASPDVPGADGAAKEFAAAIERSNASDPQSPDTLNARLAYAAFLARSEAGDCRSRLDGAQSQLDRVKASRALDAVLPAGLARAADVDYQIHSARARCGGAEVRDAELRASLESAQRAAELYRAAFDAVSMVTMQFNSSVANHDLGDSAAAVSALQETIALDREYGYADDAEDNYALLLQWKNEEASADQVDARMQDFPERSATLAFGWFPSTAEVNVDTDYTQVADGQISNAHGTRRAQRLVRKRLGGWKVSFESTASHVDLANPPLKDTALQAFATSLAGMLLQLHDFDLAPNGEFDDTAGGFSFGARVRADMKSLIRDLASRSTATTQLPRAISKALGVQQSPGVAESLVAEDYNFATGTWIGATLEQGVWYNMTASLSLPLEPQVFVRHDIEFVYTRPVPCDGSSQDTACIEIVLHAAPDPVTLKDMLTELARRARLPRGQLLQLQGVTHMRLIVDPITLVAYRRDVRRYSYWSNGAAGANHALAKFEKISIVSGSLTAADDSQH